jgi:hypothetical protein
MTLLARDGNLGAETLALRPVCRDTDASVAELGRKAEAKFGAWQRTRAKARHIVGSRMLDCRNNWRILENSVKLLLSSTSLFVCCVFR